ncbi:YolD-like family protein [Paenibacillus sp. Y412MC10]|uniref:YolD-like family protein n=1 Tax=Geobacillus sp. (strain Y412MC10) TaxID=481743 RepID=UPI0011A6D1B1|nr:YolD-like family protein [Paenibacillus sp. Y412MC10]
MSKKLTDNGLFDSSRMIIPQHKSAILAHQMGVKSESKPVIDEQEWQLIGQALQDSFNDHVKVTLTVFDPFNTRDITGFVTVINTFRKEIKLTMAQDKWEWIEFGNIIAAST